MRKMKAELPNLPFCSWCSCTIWIRCNHTYSTFDIKFIFKDQVCNLCLDMKGFLPLTLQSEWEGCFWVDHSTLMVRRTLFSHRICGWGIKSPTTPPNPPTHTHPLLPLLLLFYSQSPFKYLTLHQPLCVSAQWWLTRWYPIDTHCKPSVFWMCQNWLGFQWVYMQMREVFVFPPHPSKFLHSLRISGWESYSL